MLRLLLKYQCHSKKFNYLNLKLLSTQPTQGSTNSSTNLAKVNANVPGLSEKCVKIPKSPVGPNAAKDREYKNPEYFCYNEMSFAEAEVEMEKFRLPAPSNKEKFLK